jgi:hypothetical protein
MCPSRSLVFESAGRRIRPLFQVASFISLAVIINVMFASRRWRAGLFVLAVACVVPSLSAELVEIRVYHGKQVQCIHSGIYSAGGKICGTFGYARVFTGTVKSAVEISDTDKRLELIPDEVFLGTPAAEVTATVNQACLPRHVKPGDKWLFYLQSPGFSGTDEKSQHLVLPYDSPSKPVSSAQVDIVTLQHLARLTDSGLLTGTVSGWRTTKRGPASTPSWRVTASQSGKTEYNAFSDGDGHFEIELPAGSYHVTANTERGLWAPEIETFVSKAGCTEIFFPLHADGRISGTVASSEGKPARYTKVAILRISPKPEYFTVMTDDQGHFEVGGRNTGRYIVGADVLDHTSATEWPLRVYYPGVPTRDQALPIDLGEGEWRTDIDFKLLPNSEPH